MGFSIFGGGSLSPGLTPSNHELMFRVAQLEQRNQELAIRVRSLEVHIKLTTPPNPQGERH